MDLCDQFVRRQHGDEWPKEEYGGRDQPAAGRADKYQFAIAGDGDARHFGGRVRMRQAATDSAAFTDRVMRHMVDGSGKQRVRSRKLCIPSISLQRTLAPR